MPAMTIQALGHKFVELCNQGKNFDVMEAKLLELHPAEIMDVGGVAFHFLQVKIDFRLRDRLGVIRADDF